MLSSEQKVNHNAKHLVSLNRFSNQAVGEEFYHPDCELV